MQNLSNTPIDSISSAKSPQVENLNCLWGDMETVSGIDPRIGIYSRTERGLAKLLGAELVHYPNGLVDIGLKFQLPNDDGSNDELKHRLISTT